MPRTSDRKIVARELQQECDMLKLQIMTLQQTVDAALLAEFANDDDDDEAFSQEFLVLMIDSQQHVQDMCEYYLYTEEKLNDVLADH